LGRHLRHGRGGGADKAEAHESGDRSSALFDQRTLPVLCLGRWRMQPGFSSQSRFSP
jgi:hypothetical protein